MPEWSDFLTMLDYDPMQPLLFNSVLFLALFTVFYGVYILLANQQNFRLLFTLLFSLYFYYLSSGFYFWILLLSTVVDFVLGHFIYNARERWQQRGFLILSLMVNLGLLGYFKYTNFFIDVFNQSTDSNLPFANIFLPVGISFYTFQTMSYSIDVYRRKLKPLTESVTDWKSGAKAFLDFAFFVSFFPQLVAGPIVRAADFLPQIRKKLHATSEQMGQGFALIISGLFKKAIISDYISVNFVDRVFENPALYSGTEAVMAAYGYAVQIYCDFSGYSDMAIGIALLLGFQLPENFRFPYQAKTLQEFWRRWHISLSTWLRDYLYISMGGNRKGLFRTYLHLMLTMLLGGLWHGASWVFILWGGIHGVGLALDRMISKSGKWLNQPSLRSLFILLLVQIIGMIWVQTSVDPDIPGLRFELTKGLVLTTLGSLLIYLITYAIDQALGRKENETQYSTRRVASIFFTFQFVIIGWIFFRSGALNNPLPPMETVSQFFTLILTNFNWSSIPGYVVTHANSICLIILALTLHWLPINWHEKIQEVFTKSPVPVKALSLALVIWCVVQTASADVVPFIYFQF